MRYRAWDANGDYTFGQGSKNFLVNSPQCVAQAVVSRLRLQLGEWFIDTSDGTPWTTEVQGFTAATRDLVLQDRIVGTQGVTDIAAYNSALSHITRSFAVAATIDTQYGQASITVAESGEALVNGTPVGKPAPYTPYPKPAPNPTIPAPQPSPVGG